MHREDLAPKPRTSSKLWTVKRGLETNKSTSLRPILTVVPILVTHKSFEFRSPPRHRILKINHLLAIIARCWGTITTQRLIWIIPSDLALLSCVLVHLKTKERRNIDLSAQTKQPVSAKASPPTKTISLALANSSSWSSSFKSCHLNWPKSLTILVLTKDQQSFYLLRRGRLSPQVPWKLSDTRASISARKAFHLSLIQKVSFRIAATKSRQEIAHAHRLLRTLITGRRFKSTTASTQLLNMYQQVRDSSLHRFK